MRKRQQPGRSRSGAVPPLTHQDSVENDVESGLTIRVTLQQRGLLSRRTKFYDAPDDFEWKKPPSARQVLEGFANTLRADLEKKGLPNDREEDWRKTKTGQFVPIRKGDEIPPDTVSFAGWTGALKQLTEPLSRERITGELLNLLAYILRIDGLDPHLAAIGKLMNLFSDYRIAGDINSRAYQAMQAEKARAQGPAAKRKRAENTRRIVIAQAETYWARHAAMRGKASNTAAAIIDTVNEELQTRGLLPSDKGGLSIKTIGDHIRRSIRG